MISVNTLRNRKRDFEAGDWIMDSGAFTEISTYGEYRHGVGDYAKQIRRWSGCGNLVAAVAQDYMCEPFIVEKTGLSVGDHQKRTIERFDALAAEDLSGVYLMPALQGFEPGEYQQHVSQYGHRLPQGAWVGVGSVCKRNSRPGAVRAVLSAIKSMRPDLRLHGFGLKITALADAAIRDQLYSADSMAWSFAARMEGRNGNDWREAVKYVKRVNNMPVQEAMEF